MRAGITRYTGVAESRWIEQILAFGWRAHLLGPLREIAGSQLGAIAIEIDDATPDLLARAGIYGAFSFADEVSNAA